MKPRKISSANNAGFTVVEVMVTVVAVGILAGVAVVGVNNVQENVRHEKLAQDVRELNTAIQLFQVFGGVLDDETDPESIVSKLKYTAKDPSADRIVGLSGRFVDTRLNPELMTPAELASDAPRAVLNNATKQFELRYDNLVPGPAVKRFSVDPPFAWSSLFNNYYADRQDLRDNVPIRFAKDSTWVWDYEDSTQTPPGSPTSVPLLPGTPPTVAGAPPGTSPLMPPDFSIPGGTYPLASYDKSLTFTNPNDPSVSEILYSIVLGSWVVYDGTPVVVTPGAQITAYARSTDPALWTDSPHAVEKYAMEPIPLDVAFIGPVSLSYAEVGGPMMPGGPAVAPASPGTIVLANAADVPDEYENNGSFNVYWSYDGTDPLDPGDEDLDGGGPPATLYGGDPFSGGFPGQPVDLLLPKWGAQTSLPVKFAARSFSPDILETSPVVTHTVAINQTGLRSPLLTDLGAAVASLDLVTTSGDMPVGARIFYTIDGTDPGDDGFGNPVSGMEYAGPFSVKGNGTHLVPVTARVYGPTTYPQWFTLSDPVSEIIAVPPAAISFTQTASLSEP